MKKEKVAVSKKKVTLHQKILGDFEENIITGKWPPGHKIPFEHELIEQYDCSRMTVNKVLTQLVKRNLIERRRRLGSFVTIPSSISAVLEITDIQSEVEELGQDYHFEVFSRKTKKASAADQKLLGIKKSEQILKVLVCHYANKKPFCLEERLICLLAVPDAAEESFNEIPPGSWLRKEVPWNFAEHRIRAVGVTDVAAAQLGMTVGSPALVVNRRTWNAEHVVTHVRLTYPADMHQLLARFSPSGG